MKLKAEREIIKKNRFEKKWRMKASQEKFKIIPIAQRSKRLMVNGNELNTSTEGKLLGLKIHSTGFVGHAINMKNKTYAELTKLGRYTNLTPKF